MPGSSGDGEPFAVNNSGLIVGEADTGTGPPVAAEWQNGAIKVLGALSTGEAAAFAVNSAGQAVGASLVASDGDLHAVLFANGTVTDLNPPRHRPGRRPGQRHQRQRQRHYRRLWRQRARIHLPERNGHRSEALIAPGSAVTLVSANGINNQGDIVGIAVPNNNPHQSFGFELIPAGSPSG
jgi:probable HAF family extracellular repeat protein